MKSKQWMYVVMLASMIAGFFAFTGGVTDVPVKKYGPPTINEFSIQSKAVPVIFTKIPFSAVVVNNSYDDHDCNDSYMSARDLVGTLTIMQGGVVVDTSNFTFVSQTGREKDGFTGTFVDSVIINNVGTYTATASFYDTNDPLRVRVTKVLTFAVGAGSETPLATGTYRLQSFTASNASSTNPPYTYNNPSLSNTLIIHGDGVTATLDINIHLNANVLEAHPFLHESDYVYNATGNYTIVNSGGKRSFRIEYESSAFVTFNFSFDGSTLTLNYAKDGTEYVLKFVKL